LTPEAVFKYFPELTERQKEQVSLLKELYGFWNEKINVISRKDTDNFYTRHVLHSLAIAKFATFSNGTKVLDVGTGGGFPGIPLAILFPTTHFTLLDSIEKKIKVVSSIANELKLENVTPTRKRVEEEVGKYHFIVSRAVMEFQKFLKPANKLIIKEQSVNAIRNGMILLKGGNLYEELGRYADKATVTDIPIYFDEPYFETKKIIYYPV
jgi:16S rRNA (guanine527-N7)-methyltransferase